jgi:hypothetical protein
MQIEIYQQPEKWFAKLYLCRIYILEHLIKHNSYMNETSDWLRRYKYFATIIFWKNMVLVDHIGILFSCATYCSLKLLHKSTNIKWFRMLTKQCPFLDNAETEPRNFSHTRKIKNFVCLFAHYVYMSGFYLCIIFPWLLIFRIYI